MANVDRIRKVENDREFENVIDDFITQGYEVLDRGENSCRLRENKGWGSIAVHILLIFLTGWWTFGIGNLIYALITRYKSGQKLLIKIKRKKEENNDVG